MTPTEVNVRLGILCTMMIQRHWYGKAIMDKVEAEINRLLSLN